VIVTLAAWLYIIQALLGLGSLFSGPFGLGGGTANVATFVMAGIFGAMGYGLLKREAWGRWLALGVSLLSWVFGSLFLIGALIALAAIGKSGALVETMLSGAMAIIAVVIVVIVLIMIASVVISFKLFFYLCSQEGCEEFGVPRGSAGAVLASVGAWIAIMIGQIVLSGGGVMPLLAAQAMARNARHDSGADRQQMQVEAERREYQRQHEEAQRRADQEARLRAIRDAEDQQAVASARNADALQASAANQPPMADEAREPTMTAARDEEEKTTANQILKCRDSSGAVTFTQGYCPPGTQRVSMPKSE